MLRWRLSLGALLIGLLIALCWLDHCSAAPGLWLLPVALVAVVLSTGEILRLARTAQLRPVAWPVYATNLLLVLAHWAIRPAGLAPASRLAWIAVILALGVLAAFVAEIHRYQSPGGVTANLGASGLAMLYVGLLLSITVQLRMTWGVLALVSLLVVVKMGDTGAYTIGRLIGRHKMAPVLSPGKTWEGAAGAVFFACLGSWLCFHWTAGAGIPGGWLLYGLLVGITGIFGDLAESLLKRDVGCKDSSHWMPGFGGVLDMVDSVLLAAPVAWICWALGLVSA